MSALAASLSDGKLAGRVFDERQLAEAIGGSDARRYALVNRALKDGTLIRLKRGTYLFPQSSRAEAPHPFAVAQDRKSTRLNSSHYCASRMPSSACKQKPQATRNSYPTFYLHQYKPNT